MNKIENKINQIENKLNEKTNLREVFIKLNNVYTDYEGDEELKAKIYNKMEDLSNKYRELKQSEKSIAKEIEEEFKSTKSPYTLSQLKKDIENRAIKLQAIYCDFGGIKEIQEVRPIGFFKSNSFSLVNSNGTHSWIYYIKSDCIYYSDNYLVFFSEVDDATELIYKVIR